LQEIGQKMTRVVPESELTGLVERALVRHGMSDKNALAVARVCVGAERDGSSGHGLFRLAGYISTLKSGWVDGKAVPIVDNTTPSVVRVDARNGFAQPALEAAKEPAIAKTRTNGSCVIAIRDSHHLAALWPDVEMFAREGLVAFAAVSSIKRVVPWGGRAPVYGTNPMAFAVPRANGDPLVFDQASSAMAFGEVRVAAQSGHAVPEGVGVDRDGKATTDAQCIVDGGSLLPFGGYKGSSIAMMIEVLAAALTGGNFSFEFDLATHPGAQTPRTGEFVLLIDPQKTGEGDFGRRIDTLVGALHASGQERLPGDRRYQNRKKSVSHGIPVSEEVMQKIQSWQ
jgi:delta1-piperideine-2-carboxylate reductase